MVGRRTQSLFLVVVGLTILAAVAWNVWRYGVAGPRLQSALEAACELVSSQPLADTRLPSMSDVEILEVKRLLAMGAPPETRSQNGYTALAALAAYGDLAGVRVLLRGGAAQAPDTHNRMTPLHWAALGGHAEIVRELLAAGASVDQLDAWEATPLWKAALMGHREVVHLLLQHGANPRMKYIRAVLAEAAGRGHAQVVRMLLDKGVDPNAPSGSLTPLVSALTHRRVEIAKLLLARGAHSDARSLGVPDGSALLQAVLAGEVRNNGVNSALAPNSVLRKRLSGGYLLTVQDVGLPASPRSDQEILVSCSGRSVARLRLTKVLDEWLKHERLWGSYALANEARYQRSHAGGNLEGSIRSLRSKGFTALIEIEWRLRGASARDLLAVHLARVRVRPVVKVECISLLASRT